MRILIQKSFFTAMGTKKELIKIIIEGPMTIHVSAGVNGLRSTEALTQQIHQNVTRPTPNRDPPRGPCLKRRWILTTRFDCIRKWLQAAKSDFRMASKWRATEAATRPLEQVPWEIKCTELTAGAN